MPKITMDDIAHKNAWIYFGGGMIAGKIIPANSQGYDNTRHFHICDDNDIKITICALDVNSITQIAKQGDDFIQIWV